MKLLLPLLFAGILTGTVLPLAAQSNHVDSLAALLDQHEPGSTAYWTTLVDLAQTHADFGAYRLADSLALVIAAAAPPDSILANALFVRVTAAQRSSRHELALTLSAESLERYDALNDRQGRARVLIAQANIYLATGRYDAAETTYQEARRTFAALRDTSGIASAESNLGVVDYYTGSVEDALRHFVTAVGYHEQLGDVQRAAALYNNLGGIYGMQGELKLAEQYLQKAIAAKRRIGDRHGLSVGLNSLGLLYNQTGDYRAARGVFAKLIPLKIALREYNGLQNVYLALAITYEKEYDAAPRPILLDSARLYLRESIATGRSQRDTLHLFDTFNQLANTELRATRYPTSMAWLDSAALYLPRNELGRGLAIRYYSLRADIAERMGDYRTAAAAYSALVIEQDSFYLNRQGAELAEVRTQYETAEKEKENAVLTERNAAIARQNKAYLIGGGVLFALLAGLAFLYAQLQRRRNIIAAQKTQLEALNATKDKFFGIIAHDIRSPITALDGVGEQMRYYRKKQDESKLDRLADRVDSTAKRLTALLDNLLNWALLQTGTIPYRPDSLDVAKVTDEILSLFGPLAEAKQLHLINAVEPGSMVYADADALRTILRNLVNNAVKFTSPGGEVRISTDTQDNLTYITVNDTGSGISAERTARLFELERESTPGTAGERGSGLGLQLCKELVTLNRGTIRVMSELGRGSQFVFSLPKTA